MCILPSVCSFPHTFFATHCNTIIYSLTHSQHFFHPTHPLSTCQRVPSTAPSTAKCATAEPIHCFNFTSLLQTVSGYTNHVAAGEIYSTSISICNLIGEHNTETCHDGRQARVCACVPVHACLRTCVCARVRVSVRGAYIGGGSHIAYVC